MAVCAGGTDPSRVESGLLEFVKDQLGYGLLVGGGLDWLGGQLIGLATRRGWMAEPYTQIAVAAFLYAALSLTIVRMLPVAIALAGAGLNCRTVIFMGWFGPRGLASIVLGLVYLEEHGQFPGKALTIAAVMATVLVSIIAHGLSAKPGIALLAKS